MLFSAWLEDLKGELEQHLNRLHEQMHGEQLALEIRLQRVEQTQQPPILNDKKDEKLDSGRIHIQVQMFCQVSRWLYQGINDLRQKANLDCNQD